MYQSKVPGDKNNEIEFVSTKKNQLKPLSLPAVPPFQMNNNDQRNSFAFNQKPGLRMNQYNVVQLGQDQSKGFEMPGPTPMAIYKNTDGEEVDVIDEGDEISIYKGDKKVGYVTYEVYTSFAGTNCLRFGYIQVQPGMKGKKLSELLMYFLAKIAFTKGLSVICVGHPDPGLKSYWEAMGFNWAASQQAFYQRNLKTYSADQMEGETPETTNITEAEAPADVIFVWGAKALSYWIEKQV